MLYYYENEGHSSFLSAQGRRGYTFWAREIDVPARNAKVDHLETGGLVLAEGAGMLFSPSAAPLFPGVFLDLKQSNVVSRYTCGSWWGLA